jgi:hypothetical protein
MPSGLALELDIAAVSDLFKCEIRLKVLMRIRVVLWVLPQSKEQQLLVAPSGNYNEAKARPRYQLGESSVGGGRRGLVPRALDLISPLQYARADASRL